MLKAVGVITEYDPFHNGHVYQLQEAKKKTGADLSVIVMSSNWTQRGEPAVFDKWVRTKMALENGADLVIELPIQDAVQPASIFAERAVNLVDALKCDFLSFGVEHQDWDFLKLAKTKIPDAKDLNDNSKPFPEVFRESILDQNGINLSNPNDTLAFWYAKAILNLNSKLKMVPILRHQSNHNDDRLNGNIASGKAIRRAIHDNQEYKNYLPNSSVNLTMGKPLFWDDFWSFLKYELTQTSLGDLQQIYQMNEGLENRLKQKAIQANSFNEFLDSVKTKRYTYTRLQRLFVYTLFKMTKSGIEESPQVLRVLGMNHLGQKYLGQIKKNVRLPIIDRIGKDEIDNSLTYEFQSGILEEMIDGRRQDLFRHPIIL